MNRGAVIQVLQNLQVVLLLLAVCTYLEILVLKLVLCLNIMHGFVVLH